MTRIYGGTDELLEFAKLWQEHLNTCFPAVPIFFYNRIDGRGPISIHDSFREHYDVIRYWASVGKPCEINDPHQWGLRYACDDMQATDHVLVGLMALKLGITHYVMQMMFELPPEISALDDLAKMKASYDLIEPLTRRYDFHIIKQTLSGLPSFPPDLHQAKGHLAFGIYTQLYLEPDILYVVTHSEAHHEAKAEDIIESCQITKQVCWGLAKGHVPNIWADPWVRGRIAELEKSAMYNVLHGVLLGGYEGPVTVANYHDWAKESGEDAERNYETMLLSFANEDRYATATCGVISPDARELVRQRFPRYFGRTISVAADENFITETEALEEEADQEVTIRGKSIPQLKLQTKQALVVDFGSTYTKVGLFDAKTEHFSLRYVPTTLKMVTIALTDAESGIVFFFIRLTPGDPVDIMLGRSGAVTTRELDQLGHQFHLDEPLHVHLGSFRRRAVWRPEIFVHSQQARRGARRRAPARAKPAEFGYPVAANHRPIRFG